MDPKRYLLLVFISLENMKLWLLVLIWNYMKSRLPAEEKFLDNSSHVVP